MWLKRLFSDEPVDFEEQCRRRIKVGACIVFLGLLSVALGFLQEQKLMVFYLEAGAEDFPAHFYASLGIGLMAGGIMTVFRKKREVAEGDERNKLLGLRCWAYTGYTMFLLLYGGILASGFVSRTAALVLLTVTGVYALVLMLFKICLSRLM